jgi:hypothetical protein
MPNRLMRPSASMQKFMRNVRRVLRSSVDLIADPIATGYVRSNVDEMFRAYVSNGLRPRLLIRRMKRFIRAALRASDTGMDDVVTDNLSKFLTNLWACISLQKGCVCGEITTNYCCICMQEGGGSWWTSVLCGHGFHEQCIAQCFEHDQRCPLCRQYH